jgi:hypothetical protein
MHRSTQISIKKERSKNTVEENMANNNRGQNFSTWIVAVGLTLIAAAGCAGGSLSAREKGAGIGALGRQQLAGLSAMPKVIREPAQRSAVPLA